MLPDPTSSDFDDFGRVQRYTLDMQMFVFSDVGDISYVTPTNSLGTADVVSGAPGHLWQFAASAGSSFGVKEAVLAAKTRLYSTTAELTTDPATRAKARAAMEEPRGGGPPTSG